jgi:hypothetical protein
MDEKGSDDTVSSLTKITATFSVGAGAYGECDIDVTGLTPDEIADRVMDEADVDTTLCHHCADHVIDPEIKDLTGFRVGDVDYEHNGEHWVASE